MTGTEDNPSEPVISEAVVSEPVVSGPAAEAPKLPKAHECIIEVQNLGKS